MFLLQFFKKIFKKLKASLFIFRKADIVESLARQEIERVYGIPYIQKIKPTSNAPAPAPKSNALTPAPKNNSPAPVSKPENYVSPLNLDSNKLNVGFLLHGGLGDFLIAANYIFKFMQKYANEIIHIDIFAENDTRTRIVESIFANQRALIIGGVYSWEKYSSYHRDYDWFVDLMRYPDVKRRNSERISDMFPRLLEYAYICERFRDEHRRFFRRCGDGQSAMLHILKGEKRIQQPDIYNFLGVSEKCEFPVCILENETDYIQRIGIGDRPFITLHRGNDDRYFADSVKLWPLSYYDILIRMLKTKYPDILLVQLGISHDRCPSMKDVHFNLVEETTLDQIKVLLKHATLHIDGEGGMVHLRNALGGGKSIVLFGPTPAEFYGYSENENIVGTGCNTWCEWASANWQERCLRGKSSPTHCMGSITPEMVMERVQSALFREVE